MRGADSYNESLFTTVRLESFVPANHPLRPIRTWLNDTLVDMDAKFSAMYEADIKGGRPSIAPEKLMRAMLLQVLYSVRGERQLIEQIQYNLLFRWFVGLAIEDTVWSHSVLGKNRDRRIEHDAVTELFNATIEMAEQRGLLSGEHFSVDGTLIHAWANHKSMRRKDGSDDGRPPESWHGEPHSNATHQSKSDPESRLYRKSNAAPALPSYLGHVLTDRKTSPRRVDLYEVFCAVLYLLRSGCQWRMLPEDCGRTASGCSTPACSLFIWHSWRCYSEDFEQVLSVTIWFKLRTRVRFRVPSSETNGRNSGLFVKNRDICSGYGVELNRSLSCSLTSSCQRLAGTGGSAEASTSSTTAEAAVPRTLFAISHSRIADSEKRRLPTSIRCGTHLRLRSA